MKNELIFWEGGANFELVVNDGFDQVQEGEGFDYTVGKVRGGQLKIVFEPDSGDFESVVIDGVDGFGYMLVGEEKP